MTRELSEKALALPSEVLTILARVQGAFDAFNVCARDGKIYWPNSSTDDLFRQIEAYLYDDKPVGVPPIAPETLAKIMGEEA